MSGTILDPQEEILQTEILRFYSMFATDLQNKPLLLHDLGLTNCIHCIILLNNTSATNVLYSHFVVFNFQ